MASLARQSRSFHKWIAIIATPPMLVIFSTGFLLSVSPKLTLLQPVPAKRPPIDISNAGLASNLLASSDLSISFERVLEAARKVPEAGISTWDDIARIDARPTLGLIRVHGKNDWEVQIDGRSGKVLAHGKRWKTFLIRLHEGAVFGEGVRYFVFAPTSILALVLILTGMILFIQPLSGKRKKGSIQ